MSRLVCLQTGVPSVGAGRLRWGSMPYAWRLSWPTFIEDAVLQHDLRLPSRESLESAPVHPLYNIMECSAQGCSESDRRVRNPAPEEGRTIGCPGSRSQPTPERGSGPRVGSASERRRYNSRQGTGRYLQTSIATRERGPHTATSPSQSPSGHGPVHCPDPTYTIAVDLPWATQTEQTEADELVKAISGSPMLHVGHGHSRAKPHCRTMRKEQMSNSAIIRFIPFKQVTGVSWSPPPFLFNDSGDNHFVAETVHRQSTCALKRLQWPLWTRSWPLSRSA